MLAGAIFGAAIGGDEDLIWGIVSGLLLGQWLALRKRLAALERRFELKLPDGTRGTNGSPTFRDKAPRTAAPFGPPVKTHAVAPAAEEHAVAPAPATASDASRPSPPIDSSTSPDAAPPAGSKSADTADPRDAITRLFERALGLVTGFFTRGNPLVRIGVVVLLIGVAFLLRYIGERVTVSIEQRLLGVVLAGGGLVVLGLWLRRRRPEFAMPIQGAGLGTLYLTVFAALRLYQLIGPTTAFAALLALVIATVVLAVLQNSLALAAFGVAGGFLAPIFASTGAGSHVQLFGFYLLLNGAVVTIAWFRAWRMLNWLGFVFTFGVGLAWGARYYRPEHFASVEPFLVAHVALYLAVAVLFALRQPPRLRGLVDGTLIFGTPIIAFMLQAAMLADRPLALAASAAILGSVYLSLAALLHRRSGLALLSRCFLALGAGFLTLAIPIALDARVTSALWTLEGAAIAWVGIRQHRALTRISGYGLMLLGSLAWLTTPRVCCPGLLFLNAELIGIAIVAGAFFFLAHLLRSEPDLSAPERHELRHASWIYASLWLVLGGLYDLDRRLDPVTLSWAASVFLSASALGMLAYGRRTTGSLPMISAWLVAVAALVLHTDLHQGASPAIFNSDFLAVALPCAALVAVGWVMQRRAFNPSFAVLADGALLIAGFGWLLSGVVQCFEAMEHGPDGAAYWIAASLLGAYALARPLVWARWRLACEVLVGLAAVALVLSLLGASRPTLPAWLAMLAAAYALLYARHRGTAPVHPAVHAIAFLSLIGWTTDEMCQAIATRLGRDTAWWWAMLAAVPVAFGALVRWAPVRGRWPARDQPLAYLGVGVAPLALVLALWLLLTNLTAPPHFVAPGYLPLLNVLDLSCIAALAWLSRWWQGMTRSVDENLGRAGFIGIGALAFLWLNAALLRAVSAILDLPWRLDALWVSFTVQASITLVWVGTALALMVTGSLRGRRWPWTTGAGLIALAVIKLFVIDMAASGTLARIVAFLGVALGLILAGYFVPRPPARPGPQIES